MLCIDPDAWMKCFPEFDGAQPKELNLLVVEDVRRREAEARKERQGEVLGAHALRLQSMRKEYKPKKRSKKMLCHSTIPERRKAYIGWYREQQKSIKDAKDACHPTTWLAKRPPGFFMPGGVLVANINPAFVPLG